MDIQVQRTARTEKFRGQNGLERRLLETVRWTVSTDVAFPQKSESMESLHKVRYGGIAQLGERLNGIQEVSGSIPLISTNFRD